MNLKPTDPVRTTVGMLPGKFSPRMFNPVTLVTVTLLSRIWLPSKNTMVVLEVKYSLASCAYTESVLKILIINYLRLTSCYKQ